MKSWILALVALLFVAAPVLAVDPPDEEWGAYSFLQIAEKKILVVEVDNHFYGKINQGGYVRTFSLNQFPTSRSPDILAVLKANVGKVIWVEALEFQDYTRNVQNNDGMILFSARAIPAE